MSILLTLVFLFNRLLIFLTLTCRKSTTGNEELRGVQPETLEQR